MIKDEAYYNSLDKRTKEYKKWKVSKETDVTYNSKGLGDIVEKVTEKTGIKALVKKVAGDDCGCDKRKDGLNKFSKEFLDLFVARRKPKRCFTPELYQAYENYVKNRTVKHWKEKEIEMIIKAYAHVFAIQYHTRDLCRSCNGSAKLLFKLTEELDKVYKGYKR